MADDPQPEGDEQEPDAPHEDLTLSQEEVDALLSGGAAAEPAQPESEVEAAAAAALLAAAAAESAGESNPLLTDEVLSRLFADSPGTAPADAPEPPVPDEDLFGESKRTRFSGAAAPAAQPLPIREGTGESIKDLDLLAEVILTVCAEIGRSEMTIEEVLKLGPGSLIELDKLAGEPVELLVNDRRIARGEVVVVDDSFGVRITELGP